ncbi:MAG: fumarylacetoacetate hydrolase family protein [Propionibacteriaceae bacterium]|nr:fumarylacetoacetate hydrolase family protein [Propionibacteriaceae bacterium]
MRIARYAVGDQIHFGTVELAVDAGSDIDQVADLTGDPMAGPVNLTGARHPLAEVRLLTPTIPRSKIVGLAGPQVTAVRVGEGRPVGSGEGSEVALDAQTAVFLKPNTSIIGPDEPVILPTLSHDPAVTGRLAVVIARICRQLPVERVPEVIFGYTVAHDVVARDLRMPDQPWGQALGFDSFTPLGPWIITHLSLEEAGTLALSTSVGDEAGSRSSSRLMAWSIAQQVAYLSQIMTLLPGDVVLLAGPGQELPIRPGQAVTTEIEEIGQLRNPLVAESVA